MIDRTTSASDWSDRNETYLTYDPKRRLVTTDETAEHTRRKSTNANGDISRAKNDWQLRK